MGCSSGQVSSAFKRAPEFRYHPQLLSENRKEKLCRKAKAQRLPAVSAPSPACPALPCPWLWALWRARTRAHAAPVSVRTKLHSEVMTEIYGWPLQGNVFFISSDLESLFDPAIQEQQYGCSFPVEQPGPCYSAWCNMQSSECLYSSCEICSKVLDEVNAVN